MAATAKKRPTTKPKATAVKKRNTRSVSKKASPKKSVSSSFKKIKKEVTAEQLMKFNLFAAVSNVLFAVLSVIFMSKATVVTYLPYAAKDEFASTTSTVFGPAFKTLCEVEIRYILAFIFGLSAVFSLLLATRLKKKYESQTANSSSVLRWVFTGVSLGLFLELSSVLAQVNNTVTLKTVGLLVVATSILWVISEGQNKGTKGKFSTFYLSLFTLFIAVMPLVVSLVASAVYGTERFGWHVYAFALAVVAGLLVLSIKQYKYAKNGVSAKSYLELEGKYLSVDYLVKFSTFIIFLIAFLK
jgi:hypothetical protein